MATSKHVAYSGAVVLLVGFVVIAPLVGVSSALPDFERASDQQVGPEDAGFAVAGDGETNPSAIRGESEPASFENRTVLEQRGDVARLTVQFDDTDRVDLTIGSPDVNYVVNVTVVDRDGDGQATVALNTFVAGQGVGYQESGLQALGEDRIVEYSMETDPVPGPLDAARYDLELSVDGEQVDSGVLVLEERASNAIRTWTAPEEVNLTTVDDLREVIAEDDEIASGDWLVVEIAASGLTGYVESVADLDDETNGLNFTVAEDPGLNQPERAVDLSDARLLVDEREDSLYVLLDTDNLSVDSDYEARFGIDDANPYVEAGENESANTSFDLVERTLMIDETAELPATQEASVGGSTTAAPGTELVVWLVASGTDRVVQETTATVAEDGNWSATFDLSNVEEGTNVTVMVDDPAAVLDGVVVSDDATDEETSTEEPTEETTTAGTETPDDGETEVEDGTQTPMETATTAATEPVTETETETPGESVVGAGATSLVVPAIIAVLVGFVVQRRA